MGVETGGGTILKCSRSLLFALAGLALFAASCSNASNDDVAESTSSTRAPVTTAAGPAPTLPPAVAETSPQTTTERSNPSSAIQAWPPGKYVDPLGDDSNGGSSPDDAWQTISHAAAQLVAGDTLYLMDGVYEEVETGSNSAVVVRNSGTPDAWIRITAFPGASPIVRAVHANAFKVEGASYVEISDLELQGSWDPNRACYCGSGINVDAFYAPERNHHVRILRNTISGFGAGGIPVTSTSHVEIRDNIIYQLGRVDPTQHSGISILEPYNLGFEDDADGYSNYITGNLVYQVENEIRDGQGRLTDGNCIILDRTKLHDYSGRTLVANNVCLDNGGRGIQIFESAHADVVNNTVFQNLGTPEIADRGGELGAFDSDDVLFANNLVLARPGLAPVNAQGSSNVSFRSNVYAADTAPEYAGASESGDQIVSPFAGLVENANADPNLANFALLADSIAVNAGIEGFSELLGTDINGRQRKLGSGVDVGALERG